MPNHKKQALFREERHQNAKPTENLKYYGERNSFFLFSRDTIPSIKLCPKFGINLQRQNNKTKIYKFHHEERKLVAKYTRSLHQLTDQDSPRTLNTSEKMTKIYKFHHGERNLVTKYKRSLHQLTNQDPPRTLNTNKIEKINKFHHGEKNLVTKYKRSLHQLTDQAPSRTLN